MKILITGGNGQLGRDCFNQLAASHLLTTCGSSDLDITDPQQVQAVFAKKSPEVVLNCAAYTQVDRCEEELERCRLVNTLGPAVLARQCAETGSRLIHISTDYVFDGNKPIPEMYREDDPTAPLSAYGSSKRDGEQAIAREMDNYLIIRTAWLYGMGGPNFLKTILRLALNAPDRPLKVVNDQFGSLTWTRRLAEQIDYLLASGLTGIFHATAEGFSSWYEGAVYFLGAMEVEATLIPCSSNEYPTPAHRPVNSILENSRLKAAGLNKMVSWQEDVASFARQYRTELLHAAGAN